MSPQTSLLHALSKHCIGRYAMSTSRRVLPTARSTIYRAGISARYKSTTPRKNNLPKLSQPSKTLYLLRGSGKVPRFVDSQLESFKILERFVAEFMKQNNLAVVSKETDSILEDLKAWASGASFPTDLTKPVQEFFSRHKEVLSRFTPEQRRMLCNALELTRRDAWSSHIIQKKPRTRGVKRSPQKGRRARGRKLYLDMNQINEVIRDAVYKGKSVHAVLEELVDTQGAYVLTVRVSNSIRLLILLNYNPSTGCFDTEPIRTDGHREGGRLMSYAKTLLARAYPVNSTKTSFQDKVFSQLLQSVQLICPDLRVRATRLTSYADRSASNNKQQETARRGWRVTLSLSKKTDKRTDSNDLGSNNGDKKEQTKGNDTEMESIISQAAINMFEDLLGAKLEGEITDSPDHK